MKVSPARIAAFEILTKIERDKAFSSALLPAAEGNLEAKDRGLCHALTLGVLRRQLYLDRLIEKLTNGKKLDSAVKIILRIGLYQLICLDKIPAHAAINDSVNLAVRAKKTSAKGFVNAVLRTFARENTRLNFADEIERISVETSHPRWLIERWTRQFGFADAAKLASVNNETPTAVFRLTAKSYANTLTILRKLDLDTVESGVVSNAWKVFGSNEILRAYVAEGKIYFQDEASQLVARIVALEDGESFLDVCAAPGSKTTLIANLKSQISKSEISFSDFRNEIRYPKSEIQNPIFAGDFYEHRIKTLQANCRRQGADSVEIVRYDAEKDLPFADESFDVVLVDAPCSGTGTIRHNPEIRYFLRAEDFAFLAEKQLRILYGASKLVKPGGRLVYSTCSLESEENEAVAEKFLSENTEFEKIAPDAFGRFATAENYARTFPQRDETDGFFVAVFKKRRVFDKV
jgi:16S rRNA (cytosine967-C5)-methyltransferase